MSRAKGFKAARRKSKKRVRDLDTHAEAAIKKTVNDVHASGRSNIEAMVRRKTGRLKRGYSKRMIKSQLKGSVGYTTPRAQRAVFYARFVHDGTYRSKAHPYHDFAVLEHEGRHRRRMRAAASKAVTGKK